MAFNARRIPLGAPTSASAADEDVGVPRVQGVQGDRQCLRFMRKDEQCPETPPLRLNRYIICVLIFCKESLAIKALFGYNTPTVQLLGICRKEF